MTDFETWVSDQPDAIQRRVLGREAQRFFRGACTDGEVLGCRRRALSFGWTEPIVAREVVPAATPPADPQPVLGQQEISPPEVTADPTEEG
jgi:hypothetical protein